MAAKFFTGMPLDGPDPECVLGHGELELVKVAAGGPPARAGRALQAPARRLRPRWRAAGSRRSPWRSAAPGGRCPSSVYKAIIAGSERGVTLADNLAAFGELGFAPHVAEAPAERDAGRLGDGPGRSRCR